MFIGFDDCIPPDMAVLFGLQCHNMGHNGHGIYGVIMLFRQGHLASDALADILASKALTLIYKSASASEARCPCLHVIMTLITPGIRPSGKMSIIVHGYDR